MKQKLPVIFAIISALILCALIVVGLVSPGSNTERSSRLFASASPIVSTTPAPEPSPSEASEEEPYADVEEEIPSPVTEETEGDGEEVSEEATEDSPRPEPLEKYNELLEINPYVAGWLAIDDSVIDDPVVYTPKSQNYFLHRDLDGSDLEKGTFFIANIWRDDYNNTLIYGHNMRDGSGFGSLAKYADASYGASHPILHFNTLYEDRDYELMAAFYSQIDEEELETEEDRENADKEIEAAGIAKKQEEEGVTEEVPELTLKDLDLYEDFGDVDIYRQEKDEDDGRFRYYYYTDLSDEADFDYFIDNVMSRALYDTGVTASWGDELLTLSTCSYHVKNGRFIVVAKRIS